MSSTPATWNLPQNGPLTRWEVETNSDYLRHKATKQFIQLFNLFGTSSFDGSVWGDEIEYAAVELDKHSRTAKLMRNSPAIVADITEHGRLIHGPWEPDAFGVESMPAHPYSGTVGNMVSRVESSIVNRRKEAQSRLDREEHLLTLGIYPRMLCPRFSLPVGEDLQSTCSERSCVISAALGRGDNARLYLQIPVFIDTNTIDCETKVKPQERRVCGQSCCALQVTFQAANLEDARYLHDQMLPLVPIMLALTASSPFFRGYLTRCDSTRKEMLALTNDDRMRQEVDSGIRGRWDVSPCYISAESTNNDVPFTYDEEVCQMLLQEGVDESLSRYIANLLWRDPLIADRDLLNEDGLDKEYFQEITSTMWYYVKFKIPSKNGELGWRLEFRPMEVQPTDYENAAFLIFVAIYVRTVRKYKLDFTIPVSKIDENMTKASKQNAVLEERFYFRDTSRYPDLEREMTLDEIFNGKISGFPGLLYFMEECIQSELCEEATEVQVLKYLDLVRKRASGEIPTPAAWMREFVKTHPDYKMDSVVSETINYDLLRKCSRLTRGLEKCPSSNN